jgi:hypothetical protein
LFASLGSGSVAGCFSFGAHSFSAVSDEHFT